MSKWTIERVTDYCFCDGCRATTDPIFEVAFRRQPTATAQWNYLCTTCAEKLAGEGTCEKALRYAEATRAAKRERAETNIGSFRFRRRDTSRVESAER